MTELEMLLNASIVDGLPLATARQQSSDQGLTPLSPVAAQAVTLLTTLTSVSNAAVISDSGAVAVLAVASGMAPGGVVTLINPQPEVIAQARTAFSASALPKVQLRPITGIPRDVMSRLADGAYDLVLVEDMCDQLGLFVEDAARLLRSGSILILPNSLAHGHFHDVLDPADAVTDSDHERIAATTLAEMLEETDDFTVYRLPIDAGMTVAVRN